MSYFYNLSQQWDVTVLFLRWYSDHILSVWRLSRDFIFYFLSHVMISSYYQDAIQNGLPCISPDMSWRLSWCLSPRWTCSPCRVWTASASLCAPAAAGRSRTATTCWPWTNSGTCAASSAASANSTWNLSSPASARTAASTARRTTTGRRTRRAWSSTVHPEVSRIRNTWMAVF